MYFSLCGTRLERLLYIKPVVENIDSTGTFDAEMDR